MVRGRRNVGLSSGLFLVLPVLLLSLAFAQEYPYGEKSFLPAPLIIGHRGAPGYRPEETTGSYELAYNIGTDFLEVDLCATKDSVLFCRHDCDLSISTNIASVPILQERNSTCYYDGTPQPGYCSEDFTWEELQAVRAVERIPTIRPANARYDDMYALLSLDQYLQLHLNLLQTPPSDVRQSTPFSAPQTCLNGTVYPPANPLVAAMNSSATTSNPYQVGVYIETKNPSYFASIGIQITDILLQTLAAYGYNDLCSDYKSRGSSVCPVFLQSFEYNLANITTVFPRIQLLEDSNNTLPGSGKTYDYFTTDEGLRELGSWAFGIGPSKTQIIPEINGTNTSPTDLVIRTHKYGLQIHPYTFRNEKYFMHGNYNDNPSLEYEDFFNLGVDGVFTDFSDTARAVRDQMFYPLVNCSVPSSTGNSSSHINSYIELGAIAFLLVVVVGQFIFVYHLIKEQKKLRDSYSSIDSSISNP